MGKNEACLVCGKELVYYENGRKAVCVYCGKEFVSNAMCKDGHYVCDSCHAEQAIEKIKQICLRSRSENPVEIAFEMMNEPFIHMHGPENHVLVGAALLAAYHNSGGKADVATAFEELKQRATGVPGGACGFWGCCGAAVSSGIFISIVTGSTPLATDTFGLCNKMTSASLGAIGEVGGPRCCKRNAFLSIEQAAAFCSENLGVKMLIPENILCTFSSRNQQCIGKRCPYNKSYIFTE